MPALPGVVFGAELEPHVNGYRYTPNEMWNPLFTVLLEPSPCSSELASRGDTMSKSRIEPVRKLVIRGIVC